MNTSKNGFKIYATFLIGQVEKSIIALDNIYNVSANRFETELKEFENQKLVSPTDKDLDNIYYNLKDSEYLSYSGSEVLSQYMLVATFSLFEKAIKEIFSLTNKFSKEELENCYKEKELKKILKNKFGFNYQSLNESTAITELRYLNNCIKHNGKANNGLIKANNKWERNLLIENVYEDFDRLKGAPIQFLNDLITKIEPLL